MHRRSCHSLLRRVTFVWLLLLAFSTASISGLASNPDGTATAEDVDLICHTDNPSECYPKIFQPTKEFQKVHSDQDLPPGLHVRLDISTGEKEAKLNDPSEQNPALEGLPIDLAVVEVEPDSSQTDSTSLPSGAPLYEPIGLVKAPTDESKAFYDALAIIKKGVPRKHLFSFGRVNASRFDSALEIAEELSHDIYYGVKISEDEAALKSLLCLMSTRDVFLQDKDDALIGYAQQAAAVVAGMLQNNPTSLRLVEKSWSTLLTSKCSSEDELKELKDLIFGTFCSPETCLGRTFRDTGSSLTKSRVSAISGLLKSDIIKRDFLSKRGMTSVLDLLVRCDSEYEAAKPRAANLVTDTFLDENMGASLGLWPNQKLASAAECKDDEFYSWGAQPVKEQCWDHYIQELAGQHKDDESHWSLPLWGMLKERREADGAEGRVKDEL